MMAGFGSAALSSIGMAVPGAAGNFGVASPDQGAVETDEEKRRRLALQQQRNNPSVAGLTALRSVGGAAGAGGAGRYGGSLLTGFGL
jgi:hypothetical protein